MFEIIEGRTRAKHRPRPQRRERNAQPLMASDDVIHFLCCELVWSVFSGDRVVVAFHGMLFWLSEAVGRVGE
jgi:hypothetical protein